MRGLSIFSVLLFPIFYNFSRMLIPFPPQGHSLLLLIQAFASLMILATVEIVDASVRSKLLPNYPDRQERDGACGLPWDVWYDCDVLPPL
jgi:hypothetical protein